MQDYEERQQARKERYARRAEELRAQATRLHEQAYDMGSAIPPGQPILIGHHSERRDRRYRERINTTYGRAFASMEKAEYYARKAESVGKGGISSDDPDALQKLRDKLAKLREKQDLMKAVNAAIRKHKVPEKQVPALIALGLTEAQAQKVLTPDCFGHQGFAPFSLQNNGANIRRVEQRIQHLERAAQRVSREEECVGYTYREDVEENRIMFLFDGKPEEEVRTLLKTHGFRWSPRRAAWVRMFNNEGRWAAGRVREQLDKLA